MIERVEAFVMQHWKRQPAQVLDRYSFGVDHGAEGLLLFVYGEKRVHWRMGSTHWAGQGARGYSPSAIEMLASKREILGARALEGRWTKVALADARTRIAHFFGMPESQVPTPDKNFTYTWDGKLPRAVRAR